MVQQRGLAGTEEAGDDGRGNAIVGRDGGGDVGVVGLRRSGGGGGGGEGEAASGCERECCRERVGCCCGCSA